MKGDALRLAQLSAQIQTVAAATGVLRVASSELDIAAQAVDLIPAGYASKDAFAAGFAFLTGQTSDVQASLRNSIAQARVDVARYSVFYVGYGPDDQDQEISTAHSMGIASTLQFVNKVLNNCIDEIGDGPTIGALDLVAGVQQVLQTVATATSNAITSVVQGAANTVAGVASAFWIPLVVVGAGALLVVAYQKGWLQKAVA